MKIVQSFEMQHYQKFKRNTQASNFIVVLSPTSLYFHTIKILKNYKLVNFIMFKEGKLPGDSSFSFIRHKVSIKYFKTNMYSLMH